MTQKVLLWPPQGIYVPSPVLTNHYTITLEIKCLHLSVKTFRVQEKIGGFPKQHRFCYKML